MEKRFRPRNRWPFAADPRAAEHFVRQFAAIGADEAALVENADASAMLVALGGNSPFLAELALSHSDVICRLFAQGPEVVLHETTATIAALPPTTPRAQVAASLRQARQRAALAIAIADIGGFWTLRRITAALSEFAQTAIGAAVAHLLDEAASRGALVLPNPGNPQQGSGFAVLGMGKLGAQELNFSSDVDLVLLYDPEHHASEPDVLATLFNRLARALVGLLQDRTADGYVFRVDLRLRPDPGATPLAVALPAALAYYESMGQTWERAAMLKARPIAGDLALGRAFLDAIRPFVWRRHLDFTAIADIHAMKRRIDAQAGPSRQSAEPLARIAGRNVKLGRGGIREIEFLVQTLQLIWGGRDPALRIPATVPALS
ncbi:MAG: glutamate-ammonia-ligase adenylyltransferase, partial [Acetobacteraceae bacterium]|nr:glutamate-ammonia-ligase adenylyltransferase [Acetobacteraceae bacterium]